MISGIGVDLVDKARFKNLVKKFGNRAATKILSKAEYLEYKNISINHLFYLNDLQQKKLYLKLLELDYTEKGFIQNISQLNITILANPFYHLSLIHI